MHHLAAYLKERENFDAIVVEHGFASFCINGEECYIKDIWVHPDFRNSHLAAGMANIIAENAEKAGCKYLTGSVMPSANNSTESVKVLLAYGFKVHSAINNGIIFRKDL
jgi:ribosomal protein S18 acetylase RimI-like enzyme